MNKGQLRLCSFTLLGIAATVHAQETGNRSAGYNLAQDVCAECHAIEPGAKFSSNPLAPPFQDIADSPGMNGLALSVWSITPHETMPNIAFSREERADIIAYILSLKPK